MVITQSLLRPGKFRGGRRASSTATRPSRSFWNPRTSTRPSKKGLIDYDDFTIELLKSVKSNPPKYSELFFDTPFGIGVARLVVNDYAYFIYTSKAGEIAMIEQMVGDGKTYHEAIQEMVRLRQQDAG